MSETVVAEEPKSDKGLVETIRSIKWNDVFPRLPIILVALVYLLLAILAPQQILDLVELTWTEGSIVDWAIFILPVLICSLANLAMMVGGVTPHRTIDTIVTALPLAAISLLVANSVAAGLWLAILLVAAALLVSWRFLDWVDRKLDEKRRKQLAVRVAVMTVAGWVGLALLIGSYPISVPMWLGLGVVTMGVGLCGLGLSIFLMWPRVGMAYLLVCAFFAFFVGGYSLVPTTVKYSADGEMAADDLPLHSPETALYAWLNSRKDLNAYKEANKPYPIIITSAEGGGIYAAAHSYLALSKMAATCPSFPQHLYATVGVSGGSIGNLLFAAHNKEQAENGYLKPCVLGAMEPDTSPLTQDLLSPLLANLLIIQSLDFLVPYFQVAPDGGEILALALEKMNPKQNLISEVLAKTWEPDAATPLLVFVSTDVNSGNRYVFAPFAGFASETAESFSSITANRGAVTSARFPWLTSTARMQVNKDDYRVLADGGYFENSGADTIIDIIQQIRTVSERSQEPCVPDIEYSEKDDFFTCKKPLVVEKSFKGVTVWKPGSIHVFIAYMPMNSSSGELPGMVYENKPTPNQSYLVDPISTMLSTRNTRGELALSRARRSISGYDDPDNVEGLGVDSAYFEDRILPQDLQLPLGWRIGSAKVATMKEFAAPLSSCTFLPGQVNDWRKFYSNTPDQSVSDQQTEADQKSEAAVDEKKEKLDQYKLDNACNMATLAWLFNPKENRDAVAIPKWD